MVTETGLTVQKNVEGEHKPGPELAQTQLQLMEVQIVSGRQLIHGVVARNPVQVIILQS